MQIGIQFGFVVILLVVVALASATKKPGQCPVVKHPNQAGICVTDCSSDYDCPDAQKCCGNGCGHVCSYPERFEVPNAGVCPEINDTDGALCIDPPPCEVDQDCQRSEKCCFNGCSKICTTPKMVQENKAGLCKWDIPVDLAPEWNPLSNCSATCGDDSNCAGDQKCCWGYECGFHACSEPALVCDYNDKIYMDGQEIIDADGCSSGCSCFEGYVRCGGLVSRAVKIVIFCLVGLLVLCGIIALVSFLVYHFLKKTSRTPQDKNAHMPQQKTDMMNQVDAQEASPLPCKV